MPEKKDAVVIQIKVEAAAVVEAMEALADAILDVFEYRMLEKSAVIKPEPKADGPPEAAEEGPKEAESDDKPETEEENTYTLEEVRAKLAALSQSGKQAEVKELITNFGAKKLTEIPAEKYSELMEKAGEIA